MISSDEIEKAYVSWYDFGGCEFDRVLKFNPGSKVFESSSSEEYIVFMKAKRESFRGVTHFWLEACLLVCDPYFTGDEWKNYVCINECKKLSPVNFISSITPAGSRALPIIKLPEPEQFESCYQMKADWNLQIFIAQCNANYYYYSWETTA